MLVRFGTEIFHENAPENLEVLGAISDEVIYSLMATCEALLIRHPQSSGMFTRLIEAEIAEIPVFLLGDYLQASEKDFKMVSKAQSLDQLAHR
jgi:hypothetical protein